jgi:hypothetical protein
MRKMLIEGKSPEFIIESWKQELEKFRNKRKKYFLYD